MPPPRPGRHTMCPPGWRALCQVLPGAWMPRNHHFGFHVDVTREGGPEQPEADKQTPLRCFPVKEGWVPIWSPASPSSLASGQQAGASLTMHCHEKAKPQVTQAPKNLAREAEGP